MKKTIQILIYSLINVQLLCADDVNFSQISSRNGLSQNTVRAIAEDKNGFIWAGTLDGLNRYDGYHIRSYQLATGNAHTLNDHRIRALFVTEKGDLWVKTYRNEFSCYNPVTDTFTHVKDDAGRLLAFENLYESSAGDVWLWGSNDGVLRMRKDNHGNIDRKQFLPSTEGCNFLLEDTSGSIWIGTKKGLKKVTERDSTENYYNKEYYFTQAIELNGVIYFSTMEASLLVYDIKRNAFEEIFPAFEDALINLFRLSSQKLLVFFGFAGNMGI